MALTLRQQQEFLRSDQEKIILCDVEYHDGTQLRLGTFSSSNYIMQFGDSFDWYWYGDKSSTPETFSNLAYEDILISVPDIISKLDSDISFGALEFLNADGFYDSYINFAWEGHPLKIYIGSPTWVKGDFIPIIDGIATTITSPRPNILALNIKDKKGIFNTKVQTTNIDHDYIYSLYGMESGCSVKTISRAGNIYYITLHDSSLVDKDISDITYIKRTGLEYQYDIWVNATEGSTIYTIEVDITTLTDTQTSEISSWVIGTTVDIFRDSLDSPYIFTLPVENISIPIQSIEIRISENLDADSIALITASVINSFPEFTATPSTNSITITNTEYGDVTNAADAISYVGYADYTTGFTINPPSPSGGPGVQEVRIISTVADSSSSLSGSFFTLFGLSKAYYIWYNVNYSSIDPEFFLTSPEYFNPTVHTIPDTILNSPVPICLGKCFNIEPKLIDASNHIYQIHEGAIEEVTAVRADGVILTPPGPGAQYEVNLQKGCFRLLTHSNNTQITCDVIGAADRGVGFDETYTIEAYTAPWMVEWLALNKTLLVSDDICPGTFPTDPTLPNSFSNLSTLGIYLENEQDVGATIDTIMKSVGGFARFGRLCNIAASLDTPASNEIKLQVFELEDPNLKAQRLISAGYAVLNINSDQIIEKGMSLSLTEPPKHTITLGYNKNWKVQEKSSLAGLVTDAQQDFLYLLDLYTNEYSRVYDRNIGILEQYPLAEDTELLETLIFDDYPLTTFSQAEVNKRGSIRSQKRYVYKIESTVAPLTLGIGDILKLTHNRFGFDFGKYVYIIGINENPTDNRVDLEVWL